MASQILRRLVNGSGLADVIRAVNRVIDMLNGNAPGRINLDGDDGEAKNPIGGASISSNNHALRVRSAAGEHLLIRNTADTVDLIEVDDTSGVTAAAISSGNVSITGNLTFVGLARRLLADFSNATISNRTLLQSSTVNGATQVSAIPNGTSAIAYLSVFNNSTPASASGEAMLRVNTLEVQLRAESPSGSYLPLAFYTNAARRAGLSLAGVFDAANVVAGGTALVGAETLRSVGTSRLENTVTVTTGGVTVAAGGVTVTGNSTITGTLNVSAGVAVAAGGVTVTGASTFNSATSFASTVTLPAIDPPTVNGQATAASVCSAYAYVTAGGGASLGNNYNIASVTRNGAGNFTVAWDRDFAGATYAVVVTVEDNAVVLIGKVNSQAAGSADVYFTTTAGTLTDPDAFSVICFGTLS